MKDITRLRADVTELWTAIEQLNDLHHRLAKRMGEDVGRLSVLVALLQQKDQPEPKPDTPPEPTPCKKAFTEWHNWLGLYRGGSDEPPFNAGFEAGVRASAEFERTHAGPYYGLLLKDALLDPPEPDDSKSTGDLPPNWIANRKF